MTKYRGPQTPNLSFYDRFCPLRHKLVVPTDLRDINLVKQLCQGELNKAISILTESEFESILLSIKVLVIEIP